MKGSILAHAMAALGRRKARSLALGGGLAFAVALIAAVLFLTESLRAEAERARAAHADIVVQKLVGGRPATIPASERAKLEDIPSVRSVEPRVWGYIFLPALQGNVTIVSSPRGAAALSVANGVLHSGRDLVAGQHEMIAGVELAHFLGMLPGDELGLPSADPRAHAMKLVGTFESSLDLWTSDVILCDEDDARALLGVPDGDATDITVTLSNPAEARVVARTIVERLPTARVIERAGRPIEGGSSLESNQFKHLQKDRTRGRCTDRFFVVSWRGGNPAPDST